MLEIERKFLVKGNIPEGTSKRIVQGYLNSHPERTVRVRIKGNQGFITVKGIGSASGASRFEFEKEITVQEAESLLELCEEGVIDKTRTNIQYGKHTFEVDCFEGENKGLLLAEVELSSEDEYFEKPDWIGEEVTGDKRYYNSYLAKHPYCKWSK